jgi:hypothetical protein
MVASMPDHESTHFPISSRGCKPRPQKQIRRYEEHETRRNKPNVGNCGRPTVPTGGTEGTSSPATMTRRADTSPSPLRATDV